MNNNQILSKYSEDTQEMVSRFLDYVGFDTQSNETSSTTPSTSKQSIFAKYLYDQLKAIDLDNVYIDEKSYVYATLPSNTENSVPSVGFISHIDTSPDCSGMDVKPRIISDYDGKDIILSEGIVSSPSKFPELKSHIGEDLIVTDGHTLLGADDKAGVAEIVQAMVYMKSHPEIKHGKVSVCFNPDEEIGLGAHNFDVERFGCDFAYTMDGSEVGEIEFENFNAASAKIQIQGVSVHPGYAKDKMVNASKVAAEIIQMLPPQESPEFTSEYEGFFHVTDIQGNCEKASLSLIIRDHDRQRFEQRKQLVSSVVSTMNFKYGGNVAILIMADQYYNMREQIEPKMYIIDIAKKAVEQSGAVPKIVPIRGGTDGAQLSFKGLPCPNIFAGGINFHGPYEFCPIKSMEIAMNTIVNIIKGVAEM